MVIFKNKTRFRIMKTNYTVLKMEIKMINRNKMEVNKM